MTTQKTLDSLITSDINSSADKILNNPWRAAEAWHYYLLVIIYNIINQKV
jgi:WD repeat-containing protein 35